MRTLLQIFLCFVCFFARHSFAKEGPPIHVFIHACALGDWEEILDEQLSRIKVSGLYDACDSIFIGVLGKGNMDPFKKKYPKIKIAFKSPNVKLYERPTLLRLYNLCRSQPHALVLYLHTKGISRNRNENVRDWRRYMEYFNIDKWQECVRALTYENYDVCGVNWKEAPLPHFSGNFWWARASYIYTLPPRIPPDYYAPEFWLGTNEPRWRCFYQSEVDHYGTPYPESCYR